MIEGFKIDVKGEELARIISERADETRRHIAEIETALTNASESEVSAPVPDRLHQLLGMPPQAPAIRKFPGLNTKEIGRRQIEHGRRRVRMLDFLASHIVKTETYRIDLGMMSPWLNFAPEIGNGAIMAAAYDDPMDMLA